MGNAVLDYYERMGREGRMITIDDPSTTLTFSICKDFSPFQEKYVFDYIVHDPDGLICFVETFVCRKFSRELLRQIEKAIIDKYPKVEYSVWFRPEESGERKYLYRRRYYETSLRN